MIHVTICDDDINYISLLKKMLIEVGVDAHTTVFSEYTSGKEFVFELEAGKEIDLLILDMQLGDITGDEVAKKFREMYPYAVLVFCSGVQLPTVKSFKTTPYRYLLKSYSKKEMMEELSEVIDEVVKKNNERFIVGHYRYDLIKVNVNNIMYITNKKRGSRIFVTPDCEEARFSDPILVNEKLAVLQKRLEEEGFEFISVSYIVNMRYVKQLVANEVVFFSGEKLNIARSCYKKFRERFTKYLAKKY